MLPVAQSLLGIAGILALAWALGENRRVFAARVAAGVLLAQFVLALILLKAPGMRDALVGITGAVDALARAASAGTSFVFGYLGGGDLPFVLKEGGSPFILAFNVLPLVILIGALAALLWHWRVLPAITAGFAFLLRRLLGVGGAVGLAGAANVFFGMTEAPLFIRAYIPRLSRGELFAVMTVGLATISGTVLVLYAVTLKEVLPAAAGHFVSASLLNVPAALLIARLMVPSATATPADAGALGLSYAGSFDAIARGTDDGLRLFLSILAMLIVTIALIALADQILALAGPFGGEGLSVRRILGWAFAPFVLLLGIPLEEAGAAGALMGTKIVLTEYVAYLDLAGASGAGAGGAGLSPRSVLIMAYALCGFANFASVGMLIGALSTLAPERRGEIAGLSLKSLLAGNLATGLSAAMVGLVSLLPF